MAATNLLSPTTMCRRLLAWYDRSRRVMPWRALPGAVADPYRVWLSEIMLQQTTVATVTPYYTRFLARWPTVEALAAASLDEVLHAWQGLGYYARARNLHRCAQVIAGSAGGRFPDEESLLLELPGVGPYTAAAIAAIAFDKPTVPVDGNVERVLARLHALDDPLPQAKEKIAALAQALAPGPRAGDFAQAMMDLGATVCTPRNPRCSECPWIDACAAQHTGAPESYPRRSAIKARPMRYGVVFWITDHAYRLLMRRRAAKGLWGGLSEFPSTPWRERPWKLDEALAHAPIPARWTPIAGGISHGFTHFQLRLSVVVGRARGRANATLPEAAFWHPPSELDSLALPTAMRRVVNLVSESQDGRATPRVQAAHPQQRRQRRSSIAE